MQLHLHPAGDGELSGWSGADERDQRGSAGLPASGRRVACSEAAASGVSHGKQHAVAAEGENETQVTGVITSFTSSNLAHFSRAVMLPSIHVRNDIYELYLRAYFF